MTRWIERGLFVVGVLLVGVWLDDQSQARAFQSTTSNQLESALHGSPLNVTTATATATHGATSGSDSDGSLGRIEIPRLRISAMIAEGTETAVLKRAVGHIASTPRFGSSGNVALAGHRDTFFRGLGGVRPHDLIRIVTVDATYAYRVEWAAIVEPHRIDVLDPTPTPSLTLVTCYPFHGVGPAPQRFVVRAVRADSAAPAAAD